MGWVKARREAQRINAAMFGIAWTVSIKLLDELAELYRETTDPGRRRNVLYEYARYVTDCWVALINHHVPAEPTFDFETRRPSAYFPAHFPDIGRLARWADTKRISRADTAWIVAAYLQLAREVRRYRERDEPGEYFDHLATYAGAAHLTLKQILPV